MTISNCSKGIAIRPEVCRLSEAYGRKLQVYYHFRVADSGTSKIHSLQMDSPLNSLVHLTNSCS